MTPPQLLVSVAYGSMPPISCAPSADAVAGNGDPLSYSLRSPSAYAVAGRGG